MDICVKIWCWLRARTRAKARGITSLTVEELTRGQQSIYPRNNGETHLRTTSCRSSSEIQPICQEHVWNSKCFPYLAAWLCEPHLWRSQEAFEEANTAPHCSTNQDVRMAMKGENFECLLDDD